MNDLYYDMIFKRKFFHTFKGKKNLSESELEEIKNQIETLKPLEEGIKTKFKIVPRTETTCRWGEYAVLIYSEKKEHYLQNVGYMGEQLDLWLASKNIGACWYGMAKPKEVPETDLEFVIMIIIEKVGEEEFRKESGGLKRKTESEIWSGEDPEKIASVARCAPSAVNSQPWFIESRENALYVYQVKGKWGFMMRNAMTHFNRVDMGIFLLILEVCLNQRGLSFQRELCPETAKKQDQILTAVYKLEKE